MLILWSVVLVVKNNVLILLIVLFQGKMIVNIVTKNHKCNLELYQLLHSNKNLKINLLTPNLQNK